MTPLATAGGEQVAPQTHHRSETTRRTLNSFQDEASCFLLAEIDGRCARDAMCLRVLRSLDLATIGLPGCFWISDVSG